jgi:diguanylate cyclase (GGDEF)-like protein
MSTRARIVLLLCLVVIPFSVLLIGDASERHEMLTRNIQDETLRLARLAAKNQDDSIELSRQLLETLAGDPAIRRADWPRCNAMLRDLLPQFSTTYSNFMVAKPDGEVACSGVPVTINLNLLDRRDFRDTISTRQFVVGEMVQTRIAGTMSLPFRMPVLNANGEAIAVVSTLVSPEHFAAPEVMVALPQDGELLIVDRTGRVIANRPGKGNLVGQRPNDSAVVRAMLTRSEGLVESPGTDGVPRMYGFARTSNNPTQTIHVAVGIPLETVRTKASRQLMTQIAAILGVTAAALVIAWFGVEVLVLKKIRILVTTLTKLREGDSSARTGMTYGADEISHIAREIDHAADDLERMVNALRQQSVHDPLTGLYNRRYLEQTLERELKRAKRENKPLAVIMADADHFKQINDTYGHDCGDKVLLSFAALLTQHVRGGDIACRFGGEEFIFIMPDAPLAVALSRAEQIRLAAESLGVDHDGKYIGPTTLSLGVAVYPYHGHDAQTLLKNADIALYAAKAGGRNRTSVYGTQDAAEPGKTAV